MKSTLGMLSLAAALTLTACEGGDDAGGSRGEGQVRSDGGESTLPADAVDSVPVGEPERLWHRKLRSVDQPEIVGDTAVVLVSARGDELDIAGLDVATGKTRWSYPFYAVFTGGSKPLGSLVYEGSDGASYVVFQRAPTGSALVASEAAPYLAVDPASGKVLARTRSVDVSSPAFECPEGDVCLSLGHGWANWRWRLGSFKLQQRDTGLPDDAYLVSEDVYNGGDGLNGVEYVGRTGAGHSWRVELSDLLDDERWSVTTASDIGVHEDDGAVVLGFIRLKSYEEQQRALRRGRTWADDRSRQRMIGLDARTGEVLWRHDGANYDCDGARVREMAVRCVAGGEVRVSERWQGNRFHRMRLALEGFDPATGEATWSADLAPSVPQREYQDALSSGSDRYQGLAGSDRWTLAATPTDRELLSLVDGSTRALSDDVVLCRHEQPFDYPTDDSQYDQRTRRVLRPCTPEQEPTSRLPSSAGLVAGAADAGDGVYLYATASAIVAASVGGAE